MKTILSYAVEAYHHSKRPVLSLIAGLAFVWGIFNNLLSQEIAFMVLSVLAVIVLIYALIKYSLWLRHVIKGRMTVPMLGKRQTTLLRNDYQANMDLLLHNLPIQTLEKFVFIMGIDRTGDLGISSEGGVVFSVLHYLNKYYKCGQDEPMTYIQNEIDKYLACHESADELNKLSYGTCVPVKLHLQPLNDNTEIIPCNLILIANSRKESPNEKDLEERMIDDNKSNIIVPKVFDYFLKANKYTGAMIGVMGTNGMGQSYQVVFSQIINQFARICYKDRNCPLQHLFISIREADYSRSHMTLSHLEKYVRQCAQYYSTLNQTTEM